MHHVAIMRPSWRLIPKILSGEKTIESRWYVSRRAPWGRVKAGDIIWFRDSGRPVVARATVAKVMELEFKGLADAKKAVAKYAAAICLPNRDLRTWVRQPKYCVLMWLRAARAVTPFNVDKRGFGNAAAWLGPIKNLALRREAL